MDQTGKSLLKLLFNEGESVCVSNSQFAYKSVPLEVSMSKELTLVSNNPEVPIRTVYTSDLILAAINPINGFRCDSNVTAYRSFLVELDSGSIKDQLGTIDHLKMPFSAQVFSGNKSVHTVITLDEDLPNEKTYRMFAEWIFAIVTLADDSCKNPSRCVRIPGAYRELDKKQRLISLKKRVSHKEFIGWLRKYNHLRPESKKKRKFLAGEGDYSKLSGWARYMLKNGITFKNGRNQTWFALAYDFALAGYTEEQTIEELGKKFEEEYDFKEKEWLSSISSAFKSVYKDK